MDDFVYSSSDYFLMIISHIVTFRSSLLNITHIPFALIAF